MQLFFQKVFGRSSQESILDLERKYSLKLPDDYIDFLKKTNGGVLKKNDFNKITIENISSSIIVDVLYGTDTGERASDISTWMDKHVEELVEDTIIIGDDLGHGFIVMICSGEFSGVYFWDDSYFFNKSTDDENTYWIAGSFSEFLALLNKIN